MSDTAENRLHRACLRITQNMHNEAVEPFIGVQVYVWSRVSIGSCREVHFQISQNLNP